MNPDDNLSYMELNILRVCLQTSLVVEGTNIKKSISSSGKGRENQILKWTAQQRLMDNMHKILSRTRFPQRSKSWDTHTVQTEEYKYTVHRQNTKMLWALSPVFFSSNS